MLSPYCDCRSAGVTELESDLIHVGGREIGSAVAHVADFHHQVLHHFALYANAPGEDSPRTIVRVEENERASDGAPMPLLKIGYLF